MHPKLKRTSKQRQVLTQVLTQILTPVLAGAFLIASLSFVPGNSLAQEQDVIEVGKHEFQRSCATCHGTDAKGDGPTAAILLAKPSDLTQLRNKHGGTFLFWRVYEQIEGSEENLIRGHGIRGHGTREMPIWGDQFRFDRDATAAYKMGVRGRILSLVHYLESIQEK